MAKLQKVSNKKVNQRKYYLRHRTVLIEKMKEYYSENKDKFKQYRKKYYRENLDKIKEYKKNNIDWLRVAKRLWNLRNRKDILKQRSIKNKLRRKEDTQFLCRNRIRRVFENGIRAYKRTGRIATSKKYPIDFKAIISYLQPFPKDTLKYHIDHIKPLCLFDLTIEEEIKKAFAPKNHQWLTVEDSLKKGASYP